jgi:hypothetical protein
VNSGGQPKLTREQALKIRELYAIGTVGVGTLAARYGVSEPTIRSVIKGRHPTVRGEADIARQPNTVVRGKYSLRPPS